MLFWLHALQLAAVTAWQPASPLLPTSRPTSLYHENPKHSQNGRAFSKDITTVIARSTPTDIYENGNNNNSNNEWSVADDWEALSAENPLNSAPDSATLFNQDIAHNAATSILADNHGEDIQVTTPEDIWLNEVIEDFLQNPLTTTPIYDTQVVDEQQPQPSSSNERKSPDEAQRDFEERMGEEIAMLVRCNESPEDMLVDTGRAMEELTVAQKHNVAQLLVWTDGQKATKGQWEASPFFREAVAKMFHMHASQEDSSSSSSSSKDGDSDTAAKVESTMDAKAASRWMTQSVGSELQSYTQRQSKGRGYKQVVTRETKIIKIGPHDSSVLKTISKYSTYGTGRIKLEGFQQLYMDALVQSDSGRSLLSPPTSSDDNDVESSLEILQLQNGENIRQIWRDLKNHGIVGPTEQEWKREQVKLEAELEKKRASIQHTHALSTSSAGDVTFVDECEILDFTYDAPPTSEQIAEGFDSKNDKYIRKSSHEQVQLAKDGKTPLYIDEGKFVFIDEESCIGCMQCVNAAPSSFLMLEEGRARTFHQRQGPDVKDGVKACPVSCMHFVSYDELKELETVRDKGDGRDDHKHMGHRRGHTPLYVAGMDSDNNHRSSWYHHIKNKCDNDGQCPQRGCFDCPSYRASGENPFFKKKAKAAQHTRAQFFIDNGDVDLWRKTEDL